MFIKLNHQSLDVYNAVREMTKAVYQLSSKLPVDERFNMVQQLRRAGLSVKLNLCKGASRPSTIERKRYFEVLKGSLIEIDAIFETAIDLNDFRREELKTVGELLIQCFAMLSNMMK
jgi:four helix bundle protein